VWARAVSPVRIPGILPVPWRGCSGGYPWRSPAGSPGVVPRGSTEWGPVTETLERYSGCGPVEVFRWSGALEGPLEGVHRR
jgi:hypothetical protein